jgi:hypothetical protein
MKQMLLLMAIVSLFTFSLTAQITNNLSGFYNVKNASNVNSFQSFGEKNKTLAHVTNMKF